MSAIFVVFCQLVLLFFAAGITTPGIHQVPLNIYTKQISVKGLSRDYKILFAADSHISLCDNRDGDVMEKALQRYAAFAYPRDNLTVNNEGSSNPKMGGSSKIPVGGGSGTTGYYAGIVPDITGADTVFANIISKTQEEGCDLLLLGGDIIDSAMYASIEFVDSELKKLFVPYMYVLGNHDFEYGVEYYTEAAFNTYLKRLSPVTETTGYHIYENDDFIVFGADDYGNRISPAALSAFEDVLKEDKPLILITHIPFSPLGDGDSGSDSDLIRQSKEVWKPDENGNSRVILGNGGIYPDETTKRFMELSLNGDSNVIMILAGHIHFFHEDMMNKKVPQLVAGAAYVGDGILIELKQMDSIK